MILDNADNQDTDYQEYLPPGNHGAILITSTNPQRAVLATDGEHEEVKGLPEAECVQLLCKAAGIPEIPKDAEDDAWNLIKELGNLPLAISHFGSFMSTSHESIAECLKSLRRIRPQSLGDSVQLSYASSIGAVFESTIEHLVSADTGTPETTGKDAVELLQVLATLHSDSTPLDIFIDAHEGFKSLHPTSERLDQDSGALTAWHIAKVPDFMKTANEDAKFRINEAVTLLEKRSLVSRDPSVPAGVWQCVSMHRVVQGWLRDRQGEEANEAVRIAKCIVALSEYGSKRWRPYHNHFRTHLRLLIDSDVDLINDAPQSRCNLQTYVQILWFQYSAGLHRDMYELASRVLDRLDLHGKEPTEELRDFYFAFAMAMHEEGSRPAQALQTFQAIARLDEKTRHANDLARLDCLRATGVAHRAIGQTKEAITILRQVTQAYRALGWESECLLSAEHELAMALSDEGETQEAIELLENVVDSEKRDLPADSPEQLAPQRALAIAYLENGQIEKATLRLEQLAQIEAMTLDGHPSTLTTQTWLAHAYSQGGRVSDAIAIYERVCNTQRLVLGEQHPDLLSSQHSLAEAYLDADRTTEAIGLLVGVIELDILYDERPSDREASRNLLQEAYDRLDGLPAPSNKRSENV